MSFAQRVLSFITALLLVCGIVWLYYSVNAASPEINAYQGVQIQNESATNLMRPFSSAGYSFEAFRAGKILENPNGINVERAGDADIGFKIIQNSKLKSKFFIGGKVDSDSRTILRVTKNGEKYYTNIDRKFSVLFDMNTDEVLVFSPKSKSITFEITDIVDCQANVDNPICSP